MKLWWKKSVQYLRALRDRLRTRWICFLTRKRFLTLRPTPIITEEAWGLYLQFHGLTVNQSNALRLRYGLHMRPTELQGLMLAYLQSRQYSLSLESWLCEMMTDAPELLFCPANYSPAVGVYDGNDFLIRYYHYGHDFSGFSSDRLVVGFSSNANAVSMTTPCFLQMMGYFHADVAFITRAHPHRHSFFMSSDEKEVISQSMVARICRALPELVDLASYKEIVTIGYSGGSFAATVGAAALGADRGVGLGGWPPIKGTRIDREWMQALFTSLPNSSARKKGGRIVYCCAMNCQDDLKGMRKMLQWSSAWNLDNLSVGGRAYHGCKDHNLLVELQRRGFPLLRAVADMLFPDEVRSYPSHPLSKRLRFESILTDHG